MRKEFLKWFTITIFIIVVGFFLGISLARSQDFGTPQKIESNFLIRDLVYRYHPPVSLPEPILLADATDSLTMTECGPFAMSDFVLKHPKTGQMGVVISTEYLPPSGDAVGTCQFTVRYPDGSTMFKILIGASERARLRKLQN